MGNLFLFCFWAKAKTEIGILPFTLFLDVHAKDQARKRGEKFDYIFLGLIKLMIIANIVFGFNRQMPISVLDLSANIYP